MLDVPSSSFMSAYNNIDAVESPLEIDLSFSLVGDQITAQAEITVTGTITTSTNHVFFVVSAPHANADADYINLVIDKSAEADFTLTDIGDSVTETATFTLNSGWPLETQNIVVMVQSQDTGNRFILQAAQVSMEQLTAGFESNLVSGPAHLLVNFEDTSIAPNGIESWAWDLDGDGQVDSEVQNPEYLYTTPGTYDVSLTVTEPGGLTSSLTMEDYITVLDGSAVYGTAAGLWVEDYSPYQVIDDIEIPEGATLEFEPGVTVRLMNGAIVDVWGALQAQGTMSDNIAFASTSAGAWNGIKVHANAEAEFSYCYFFGAADGAINADAALLEVLNSQFEGNSGEAFAAGVHALNGSELLVHGCTFCGNVSASMAGAIGVVASNATLRNNLMTDNSGGFAAAVGGKQSAVITMVNNTITGNTNTGSTHGHVSLFQSEATLQNDIVRCDEGEAIYTFSSTAGVTYSNISGGFEGEGNIDADPQFDTNPMWALLPGSPCVDAGNPDAMYNDVEDPDNTGQALWPAMGTVTCDQGWLGGPEPNHLYDYAPATGDDDIPVVTTCAVAAYPNPFNPSTTLALSIPSDMQHMPVNLAVYNVRGQRIATLLDGEVTTARTFTWNGVADDGHAVASGVYFARVSVGGHTATHKLALLK